MDKLPCKVCGQLQGIAEYDDHLWDLYHRLPQFVSRSHIEPYVFTSDDMFDWSDEDRETMNMVVEKNMAERGLCIECGRPNLVGADLSELMTVEEAKDLHDMYAEMEAERRMGA
jgi:hypothetical protein